MSVGATRDDLANPASEMNDMRCLSHSKGHMIRPCRQAIASPGGTVTVDHLKNRRLVANDSAVSIDKVTAV